MKTPPLLDVAIPELSYPFNLETDDADQQFWGDNELESTSVSDMEGVGGPTLASNAGTSYNNNNHTHHQMSRGVRNTRFCWSNLAKDQLTSRFPQKKKVAPSPTHFSTMLTQLSSFSVGPDGHSQGNATGRGCNVWKRPATRDRYRAIKEAREAAINAQSPSSSSDSDSLMERPTKSRRRRSGTPSDEDLVMTSPPGDICPTCQYRPKNAIIVHGRIGHACYCYHCTMKLLRTGGECPVCGRKIRKVVKTVRAR